MMEPISLDAHPTEEGVRFALHLPDGPLEGELSGTEEGGAEGPTLSLGELAHQVFDAADAYIAGILDRMEKRGECVSCGEGCSACCRQLVTVSGPEAFALLDAIKALPDRQRRAAAEGFSSAEQRLEEAALLGPLESINEPSLDGESHYHLASRVYGLGVNCPLLASGRCVVYAQRPVACREYFVTSPAAACADPFASAIHTVRFGVSMRDTLASLSADVLQTEVELVPLPLLMRWGREREGHRRRRWNARRLAETFLAHLEYVVQESQSAEG